MALEYERNTDRFGGRASRRSVLQTLAACALTSCAHQAPDAASAEDAYFYCFPIFEFARARWNSAAQRPGRGEHRFNRVLHRRDLADHTARAVTTPNCDTLYSSAHLDLSNGPVLARLPTLHDRYFSIAFMNAYTDNFAYVGTRATAGEGGLTLVAGPAWQGSAPTGARMLRSSTNDVWMLARIFASDPSDLAAANQAQNQIVILDSAPPVAMSPAPSDASDLSQLIEVTNSVLARSPLADPVARRAALLSRWGVGAGRRGAWRGLDDAHRQAWHAGAQSAGAIMQQGFARRGALINGWRYPPPGVGNPGRDNELRACVALTGLAALELAEAAYVRADEDETGARLNGLGRYAITLPASVPANGFWSLSMYEIDPEGRLFFTENALRRYAISARTPNLRRNADETLTIKIQADPPSEGETWLPSPAGPFALAFRLYLPTAPFLTGAWRLPPLRRIG